LSQHDDNFDELNGLNWSFLFLEKHGTEDFCNLELRIRMKWNVI
jgi:hypothetical protein